MSLNPFQSISKRRKIAQTNEAGRSITPDGLKQLSDSVFELYKPESIPVALEVVFTHGLEQGSCGDAYWKTWLARDGTPNKVWPRTWLPDEFPSAHVFSLSYDACIEQTATDGRMDLYVLGENLVQEMVEFGGIGQNGVPVVFVCHGFGGLVAKQIVVSGKHRFATNAKVQNLLEMIDVFCFYSTPHHGSDLAKSPLYLKQGWLNLHPIFGAKSPLLGNFEVLDTERSRINSEFEKCKHPSWHFCVVAETHETPEYGQMVVPEASSRYEGATYMALNTNYLDICKPKSKMDSSYQWLIKWLGEVLVRNEVHLPSAAEDLVLESLVRLEEQEEHVKGMLQEYRIVGLIGMGGSGKTTLAKVVVQSMFKDFEKSSYLDDVKSKATLDEVLVTLLRQFGIKNRRTGGDAQQSDFENSKRSYLEDLKAFVKEHKVLLVVDDVGSDENFNRILKDTDFANGNKDSRMIVTCRNWQYLKKQAPMVGKYEMVLLNRSGLDVELFSYHAFKGARSLQERRGVLKEYLSNDASEIVICGFESVCNDIVKACGGLPLSLEVVGSCLGGYLKDGDTSHVECLEFWKGALQKLQNAEPLEGETENERLWKSLRISYDVLCSKEKEKFLDIACFFCSSLRYGKHTLLRIWGGEYADSLELRNLEERCLIKINKEDGKVTMHDQLRDMGQSVVKDQSQGDFKNMTRIWEYKDARKLLSCKEQTHTTQGLSLDKWNKALERNIKWNPCEPLMDGLNIYCSNLRLLDLHEIHYDIIATIDIKDSSPMLWLALNQSNITKLPEFVNRCKELRVLDLFSCIYFEYLEDFIGNLTNLCELNLKGCENLTILPESIGNLVNLLELNLAYCKSLTTLPESIGNLVNLSKLHLLYCKSLTSLPESIGNLVNLSKLDLRDCESLTSLPESIGNLVNLSELDLAHCKSLTSLPESIGNLVNLSELDLAYCKSLTSLPESIGNLVNLSELDLAYCESLTSLPESSGNLVNLSKIDLRDCESLTSLPESIGNLVKLLVLHLWHCEKLTSVSKSIGNLVNLSELNLLGCKSLTSLPESIGYLVNLSKLDLRDCESLISLPESIGNLVKLLVLHLWHCEKLTSIPESIGNLVNLSELNLLDCKSLTSLPESIGNLVNLSELNLLGCKSLINLPESIGNLVNLSKLDMRDCESLTNLPVSIGNLVNVFNLNLKNYH